MLKLERIGQNNAAVNLDAKKPPAGLSDPYSFSSALQATLLETRVAEQVAQLKFAEKFLKFWPVVEALSKLSKDPSTKVGAMALSDDMTILSTGINGFPRGADDSPEIFLDREKKYPIIQHAEANMVSQAARHGNRLEGCTVLVSELFPCSQCAGKLIQIGTKRIIAKFDANHPRWGVDAERAMGLLRTSGIEVYRVVEVTATPDYSGRTDNELRNLIFSNPGDSNARNEAVRRFINQTTGTKND